MWGDYRCLSQQRKFRAALKEPLFQCRQHTESYWDLFTCRPVCFLIMWVRENPSRQREKREREREKSVPYATCGCQHACLSVCALFSTITVCNASYLLQVLAIQLYFVCSFSNRVGSPAACLMGPEHSVLCLEPAL